MSQFSVPQLAREIVELNRKFANAVQTDLSSTEEPRDAASRRRTGARSARQLTRFTLNRKSDTRDVWRTILEILEDGVPADEAKELVQIARASIDSWLSLAQKAREVWQGVGEETGAVAEGLDDLAAAEQEVQQLRAEADKMHAFLTSARPPIDLARLRQAQEEMAQGRFKKPEEMRSRFPTPQP